MSPEHRPSLAAALVDRLNRSRDFTISCILHIILIAVFGSSVLIQRTLDEPTDFVSDGTQFITPQTAEIQRPQPAKSTLPAPAENLLPAPVPTNPVDIVRTMQDAPRFAPPGLPTGVVPAQDIAQRNIDIPRPAPARVDAISPKDAEGIRTFTSQNRTKPGSRPGVGTREDEFQFTAYIGKYSGGNWDSTVRISQGKIENGSLPNLLYFMSSASRNKVKTNYTNVRAVSLDSDELFSTKPPFIFMTGTRDFRLSEKEVENLQKYIRLGGAIWGDSSVPGKNSRFDIAFRREMKRVMGVDKEWEQIPANHPIYTQAYFTEVKEIPSGLNHYREPAYALKMFGEIAVLYTANDYGDMWQIGLDGKGAIDTRRNAQGAYVALNPGLWDNRDGYVRNTDADSLAKAYRFGTNVVIHLLTRWETKTRLTPAL